MRKPQFLVFSLSGYWLNSSKVIRINPQKDLITEHVLRFLAIKENNNITCI